MLFILKFVFTSDLDIKERANVVPKNKDDNVLTAIIMIAIMWSSRNILCVWKRLSPITYSLAGRYNHECKTLH